MSETNQQNLSQTNGMTGMTGTNSNNSNNSSNSQGVPELKNVLAHVKSVEDQNENLQKKLQEADARINSLSAKTREGMRSALNTLMKKWMDAVETKDEGVKDNFKCGLESLVENSNEENGVWQMMVAASSLHEKQEHNLDKLRLENSDLKQKVDGMYSNADTRLVGEKRTRTEESTQDLWGDFAKSMGQF